MCEQEHEPTALDVFRNLSSIYQLPTMCFANDSFHANKLLRVYDAHDIHTFQHSNGSLWNLPHRFTIVH